MSSSRHPRVRLALAMFASAALLVAACGRRGGGAATTVATSAAPTSASAPETSAATTAAPTSGVATSTTLDAVATKAAITANWEKFFLPTTSIDDRVALLERGESLRQALVQRSADPLMQQASAKVTAVELAAGGGTATVTYDVFLNGAPALTASQGTAVLDSGVWKVGAESFCALISLGATGPLPGCN